MPKVILKSGGPTRSPARWRVTGTPGVTAIAGTYDFVPGVPTEVDAADVPALMDPAKTGGRVFELATPPAATRAPVGAGSTDQAASGGGGHKPSGGTAPATNTGSAAGEKE